MFSKFESVNFKGNLKRSTTSKFYISNNNFHKIKSLICQKDGLESRGHFNIIVRLTASRWLTTEVSDQISIQLTPDFKITSIDTK